MKRFLSAKGKRIGAVFLAEEGEGKLLGNGYRLWLNEVIVHTEEEV